MLNIKKKQDINIKLNVQNVVKQCTDKDTIKTSQENIDAENVEENLKL